MRYKAREPDELTAALIGELGPVIDGLGFALVELDLFRRKMSAQIRLIVTKKPADSGEKRGTSPESRARIGTDELAGVHRAVLPRLELTLPGTDLYVEVSSPGIDRLIKEGAEFRNYVGQHIKCWLKGADDWKHGALLACDEEKITLETAEGIQELNYDAIAKSRLGVS